MEKSIFLIKSKDYIKLEKGNNRIIKLTLSKEQIKFWIEFLKDSLR